METLPSMPPRRHPSVQIERWLRARIAEALDGDPLPSTTEVAEVFGVARETAARVYRKLAGEGLVEIRPQTGMFKV